MIDKKLKKSMDYMAVRRSMHIAGTIALALGGASGLADSGSDIGCAAPSRELDYCCPGVGIRAGVMVYGEPQDGLPVTTVKQASGEFPVLEARPGWIRTACAGTPYAPRWIRTRDLRQSIRARPLRLTRHDATLYSSPDVESAGSIRPGAFVPLWEIGRTSGARGDLLEVVTESPARARYWIAPNQTWCWRTRLALTLDVPAGDASSRGPVRSAGHPADPIPYFGDDGQAAKWAMRLPPDAGAGRDTVAGEVAAPPVRLDARGHFFPVLEWHWGSGDDPGLRRALLRVLVVSEPALAGFVFVVDTTQSMRGQLESVKRAILDCYAANETSRLGLGLGLGLVAFRDQRRQHSTNYEDYVVKTLLPLTPVVQWDESLLQRQPVVTKDVFRTRLNDLEIIETDDDDAEDAYAGINQARDFTVMPWHLFRNRNIVLITDANPHPGSDDKSKDHTTRDALAGELAKDDIKFYYLLLPTRTSEVRTAAERNYDYLVRESKGARLNRLSDLTALVRRLESGDDTQAQRASPADGFAQVVTAVPRIGQTEIRRTEPVWILGPAEGDRRSVLNLRVLMSEADLDRFAGQVGRVAQSLVGATPRSLAPAERVPFAPPVADLLFQDELEPSYLARLPFPAGLPQLADLLESPSGRPILRRLLKDKEDLYQDLLRNPKARLLGSGPEEFGIWYLVGRQDLGWDFELSVAGGRP